MAEYKPTSSEDSSQEENIKSNKVEKKSKKGCLLGCIGSTAFLAIISALIAPQFVDVRPKAKVAYLLNSMIDIVKTCAVREAEGLSTGFSDIQYLIDEYKNGGGTRAFTIDPNVGDDSCFNLVGNPKYEWGGSGEENKFTWFSINLDPNTGLVTKKCGNPSALRCKEGNTW